MSFLFVTVFKKMGYRGGSPTAVQA